MVKKRLKYKIGGQKSASEAIVMSTLLYGAGTWPMTVADIKRQGLLISDGMNGLTQRHRQKETTIYRPSGVVETRPSNGTEQDSGNFTSEVFEVSGSFATIQ